MRHLMIVNPASGRGGALEAAWRLEAAYRDAGIALETRRTERPGHASEIALAEAQRFDAIVSLGGDGSLHEVANGLAVAAAAAGGAGAVAALAAIPIGTGNDFVKSLGMAVDLESGFGVARAGRRRRIDLGLFRIEGRERTFVNQIQVGYGAHVVEDMLDLRHPGRRLFTGKLAYMVGGVLRLGYRTRPIEIAAGGGAPARRGRFFEVHIANGRFCGGGVSFAPDASLEDGLLDLVAIDDLSLFRLAPVIAAIQAARLRPGPGVSSVRAARITIRDAQPFPISADGESYRVAGGALEIESLPGAVDVLAP